MEQQDMEVIRDLLMYLAGVIDLAGNSSTATTFMYIRGNLKPVYDKYLNKEPTHLNEEQNKIPEIAIEDVFDDEVRILNGLKMDDITTLERLIQCSLKDLLKVPNIGKKSIGKINDELHRRGLKLSEKDFLYTSACTWHF